MNNKIEKLTKLELIEQLNIPFPTRQDIDRLVKVLEQNDCQIPSELEAILLLADDNDEQLFLRCLRIMRKVVNGSLDANNEVLYIKLASQHYCYKLTGDAKLKLNDNDKLMLANYVANKPDSLAAKLMAASNEVTV